MLVSWLNFSVHFYPPDIPQIGSVHIARIQQIFKQHKLANAKLEDDTKISLRISNEQLLTGSLVPVTITAEPWDNKPARAVLGAQLMGTICNITSHGNLI